MKKGYGQQATVHDFLTSSIGSNFPKINAYGVNIAELLFLTRNLDFCT